MREYEIKLKSVSGKIETIIEKCESFSDAENKSYPNVKCHGYELISIVKLNL